MSSTTTITVLPVSSLLSSLLGKVCWVTRELLLSLKNSASHSSQHRRRIECAMILVEFDYLELVMEEAWEAL